MDEDLGQATVVYENSEQDGDPIERTLENENVVYFQDHWLLKIDERDGEDVVRRIPAQRVYYVERTVEEFEDEVATLRNQIESFADDIRSTLLGGSDDDEHQERRTDVSSGDAARLGSGTGRSGDDHGGPSSDRDESDRVGGDTDDDDRFGDESDGSSGYGDDSDGESIEDRDVTEAQRNGR